MATGDPITDLTIDSSPIEFDEATLQRTEAGAQSGTPEGATWRIEVVGGKLESAAKPGVEEDLRIELTAAGTGYSGAGRVDPDAEAATGSQSGATVIMGNGPLVAHAGRG